MGWNYDMTAAPRDGTVIWLMNDLMAEPVKGYYGLFNDQFSDLPPTTHQWVSVYTPGIHSDFPFPSGRLVCPNRWAPVE